MVGNYVVHPIAVHQQHHALLRVVQQRAVVNPRVLRVEIEHNVAQNTRLAVGLVKHRKVKLVINVVDAAKGQTVVIRQQDAIPQEVASGQQAAKRHRRVLRQAVVNSQNLAKRQPVV